MSGGIQDGVKLWEWKGKNYTRRKLPCIQYTSLLHTKYHHIQFNTHHIPLSFQFWLKSHHIPSIPIQHLPCHITYFSIFRLHSKLISLYGNLYFYLTINPPPLSQYQSELTVSHFPAFHSGPGQALSLHFCTMAGFWSDWHLLLSRYFLWSLVIHITSLFCSPSPQVEEH